MAQEYELVKGFETENGTGLYDYEALANKPGVVSADAPGFAPQLDGKTSSFLRGDGTWTTPPDTTYKAATQSAAGLMSAADKKKVDDMETTISSAIDAINYPVDSVNGKTGEVVLNYDDVGAVSWDEYAQTIVQKANVVKEARGEVITLDDSAEAPLQNLKLYGKTTQNGIPTPTTPVPLESVGDDGSAKVTICGVNILPFPYAARSNLIGGVTFTVYDSGLVSTAGVATSSPAFPLIEASTTDVVYPAGTYFLSGCPAGGSLSTYCITLRSADKNKDDGVQDTGNGALFVLTEASKLHCTIYIKQGTNADGLVFKPMLSAGSSAMPYERKPLQFLEVPTPNGLPGIPVNSGGNYTDENEQQWICDEVDFEKGVYVQRIGARTLTGAENWSAGSCGTSGMSRYVLINDKTTDKNIVKRCSHFKSVSNSAYNAKEDGLYYGHETFIFDFAISTDKAANVSSWKNWLNSNPVEVHWQLTEPIETALSAEQLAAYAALHTSYPSTTIFNDAGAGMSVSYATPTSALPLTGGRMAGPVEVLDPVGERDAANKQYVDSHRPKTESGTVITLNDSGDLPVQGLRVFGKTEQMTTTGKNLVDINAQNVESGYYYDSDGTLSPNHSGFIRVLPISVLPNTAYTVSSNLNIYSIWFFDDDTRIQNIKIGSVNKFSFMTPDNVNNFRISLVNTSGATDTVAFEWLQLEFGSTATAYEPYTGGIPSPNPDYPQTLESVGDSGSVGITVAGKNLLNLPQNIELTPTGVHYDLFTGTTGAGSVVPIDKVSKLPILKAGTTYYFSCEITGGAGENDLNFFTVADDGYTAWANHIGKAIGAFTPDKDMRITIRLADKSTYKIKNYQLEVGTKATEYESYKENQILFISTPNGLPGIPVESGGNYTDENGQQWICDEVDFEKGVYVQRVDTILLDGVTNRFTFKSASTYTNSYRIAVNDSKILMLRTGGDNEKPAIFSDRFTAISYNERSSGAVGININTQTNQENTIWCSFGANNPATLTEANAWLAENNTTVMYALPEPIITTLFAEQLTQYANANLHTNYPNTTIFNDSNAHMEFTYGTPKSLLPLGGGSVSRLEVPTPTKPNDAANKDYVDKHINTVRDIISNFHSNIVEEASGEIIQVRGSAEAPLAGLKVFGKTEQITTTGKNLFDLSEVKPRNSTYTAVEKTGNMLRVYSLSSEGTYHGTSGNTVLLKTGITYTLSGELTAINTNSQNVAALTLRKISGNGIYKAVYLTSTLGKYQISVTPTEDVEVYVSLLITSSASGIKGDVTMVNIQLEPNTAATTYEPYTGGIPSPNPDYPQSLESAGDVIVGKNLLPAQESVVCNTTLGRVRRFPCALPTGDYIWSIENFLPATTGTQRGKIYYIGKDGQEYYINIGNIVANSPCEIAFTAEAGIAEFCMYVDTLDDEYTFIKPMLRHASVIDSTYEPYTVKGGMVNVTAVGKNLLDVDESIAFTRSYMKDVHILAGTYIVSCGNTTTDGDKQPSIGFYDSNGKITNIVHLKPNTVQTVTFNTEIQSIIIYSNAFDYAGSVGLSATVENLMVSLEGGTYEPYKSQTLPITTVNADANLVKLPGIPIVSGDGNYTDENGQQWVCNYIDVAQGKYIQKVEKIVFDGSEGGNYNPTVTMYQISGVPDAANKAAANNFALCDKYPFSSAANADMPDKHCKVHSTGTKVNMFIKDLNYKTNEEWKAYLSANPVTILYELEEAIEHNLTDEEVALYISKYGPNAIIYGKTIQPGTPSPENPVPLINTSLVLRDATTGLHGLAGIPVKSGGNYTDPITRQQWICDEVDFEKGVYVQRVGFGTLTGEDIIAIHEDKSTDITICAGFGKIFDDEKGLKNRYCLTDAFCTYYGNNPQSTTGSLGNAESVGFHNNADYCSYLYIRIYRSRLTTQDAAGVREYLNNHNINVLYQLVESIETPLSAEELAAYAALHTNYPNTTIFNDSEAYMGAKYVADTKMYVDKKFEELANVILNKL